MSPNRMSAFLDLVIGGSALTLIMLYGLGIFKIPFTLLFAAVGALSAIGLGLPRVFPRNSKAPLPRPIYFSVAAFILATLSFVYSFFNGEAWIPIIGGFLTLVGVAAMLIAVFRTPRAWDGSGSALFESTYRLEVSRTSYHTLSR